MTSLKRTFRIYPFLALVTVLILAFSACGGASGSKGTINVGGKLDAEANLFTEMYTQLLRKQGFTVNEHLNYGDTNGNFNAIQKGSIDLYAEFTATALNLLKVNSSYDPAKDYDTVKQQYEQKYKITWLDRAADLNDGYELCMAKTKSQSTGITTLSDLASKVSGLTLESPSDGTSFVDGLKPVYKFDTNSFKQTQTVNYSIGVTAVVQGQADVTVCYDTDGSIASQGLVFLKDDKHGFPPFNPSPIVRQEILDKYPEIKDALNPLAPKLTTQVSIDLQQKVADKAKNESKAQAVKEVVSQFLKDQGLL